MNLAIDFDGTICDFSYPLIGREKPRAFEVLRRLKAAGHTLILWTCREDRKGAPRLTEAVEFCRENGVEFDSVNCNRPEDGYADDHAEKPNRKVYADCYIDDKNLQGFPGWDVVEVMILGKSAPMAEILSKSELAKRKWGLR